MIHLSMSWQNHGEQEVWRVQRGKDGQQRRRGIWLLWFANGHSSAVADKPSLQIRAVSESLSIEKTTKARPKDTTNHVEAHDREETLIKGGAGFSGSPSRTDALELRPQRVSLLPERKGRKGVRNGVILDGRKGGKVNPRVCLRVGTRACLASLRSNPVLESPRNGKCSVVPSGRICHLQVRDTQPTQLLVGHPSNTLRLRNSKTQSSHPQADGLSPVDAAEAENKRRPRRPRRKKTIKEVPLDNLTRIKKRVKYLLMKIRVEQNLIDAYSAEGWKGQSREKIRPEQELQRAEMQILHSKLAIREAIHELDDLGTEGSLDESAFDSEGRIYHEEIFCAKCRSQEALLANDIILCDGTCNRGFHQHCLDPPLATEDIPPGDEGWLCPVCDCKLECIDVINAYSGTSFEVENSWKEVFAEAAATAAGNGTGNGVGGDWPSSDSEDDDYEPVGLDERPNSESEGGRKDRDGIDSSDSGSGFLGGGGASDAFSEEDSETSLVDDSKASLNAELRGGSRRGNRVHRQGVDSQEEEGSVDSSSEESEASLVDEFKTGESKWKGQSRKGFPGNASGANGIWSSRDRGLQTGDSALEEEGAMVVSGKRHRKAVDYKKLHDEMFGHTELDEDFVSEDEDWGPQRRRRRINPDNSRRLKPVRSGALVSNATASLGGEYTTEKNQTVVVSRANDEGDPAIPSEKEEKRRGKRLPDDAVEENDGDVQISWASRSQEMTDTGQTLRRVVAENQLPSRSYKEELSQKLGLSYRQVNSWFKNQRHQALRKGFVTSSRLNTLSSGFKSLHADGEVSTSQRVIAKKRGKICVNQLKETGKCGGMRMKRDEIKAAPHNSYLLEKLDEVQLRLLDLKRTMEEFAKTTAAVDEKDMSGEKRVSFEDKTVEPLTSGNQIVYVPVAEVRERPPAGSPSASC